MIDSVKKAFVLSVKALKLFYVLAAVNIITNVINIAFIPAPVNAEMTAAKSFGVMGITAIFMLVSIFLYGGALGYIKELIKTGTANIASFVDSAKKYFLRILTVWIITFLIFLIVGIILFTILGVMPGGIKPLLTVFVILVFVAMSVIFIMPGFAVVGSDLGAIESLKKGVLMGKNNFLKLLGILVLMILTAIAVMIIASLLSGILSLILKPLATYVAAAVMAVATALLAVILNIAYMDFYLKS